MPLNIFLVYIAFYSVLMVRWKPLVTPICALQICSLIRSGLAIFYQLSIPGAADSAKVLAFFSIL